MAQVKILLIDDSSVIHTLLHEVISKHNDITIIGDAYNGREGVEMVKTLSPDVIIMDIDMPEMSGLEAIVEIMNEKPLPIIVFSSATKDNADISFKAIELGAVEIIGKPLSSTPDSLTEFMNSRLMRSIKTFADFKVIRRIKRKRKQLPLTKNGKITETSIGRNTADKHMAKKRTGGRQITQTDLFNTAGSGKESELKPDQSAFAVIGIASSTGGPQTLKILIEDLSKKNINACIIILQHMADGFVNGFHEWISQYSSMPVTIPVQGEKIEPGRIYIAPGGHHLVFDRNSRIDLLDLPPVNGIRPAADMMFNSMGEVFRERAIAVILTGMGRDGSKGIEKIKENNGYIISQDEESSLLFGMPKSAFDTGLVDRVININYMSEFLEEYLRTGQEK